MNIKKRITASLLAMSSVLACGFSPAVKNMAYASDGEYTVGNFVFALSEYAYGMKLIKYTGAGAANQAIKAIAIARGYLAPIGIDLICVPAFANIVIDGEERTAIKLICEQR